MINYFIIKKFIKSLYHLGIIKFINSYKSYYIGYKVLKEEIKNKIDFILGRNFPVLDDRYTNSGTAKGSYFYQDLLVAQRIFENNPKVHIDIGSRVDGFVAHVASFRPILIIDIRPLKTEIQNISYIQHDLMTPVNNNLCEACDSLSCLHALEHFGLGRYGDPINYNGHLIGLESLYKLLKVNGKLYLSVPIGLPQRIEFNANRIFSLKYLLEQFKEKYILDNFSYVDDDGNLYRNIQINKKNIEENLGIKGNGREGCGIFEMTKI